MIVVHHRPGETLTPVAVRRAIQTTVTAQTTLAAVEALQERNPVALVFASARTPGGAWRQGLSRFQEEHLCLHSDLGRRLESEQARPFYEHHQAASALNSDWCLYVPRVQMREGQWTSNFIVCAAPIAPQIGAWPDREETLRMALRARAARIFEVAAHHGHRLLVLGAWGCGNHGNDPAQVIDAFAWAVRASYGVEEVVFAVPGPPELLNRFRQAFGLELAQAS